MLRGPVIGAGPHLTRKSDFGMFRRAGNGPAFKTSVMDKEFTADQIPQILLDRGWKRYGDGQFIKHLSVLHLYSDRLRFWEDLRAATIVCRFDLPISESDFNNLIPCQQPDTTPPTA